MLLQTYDVVQSIAAQQSGQRPGLDGLVPEQIKWLPMRAKLLMAQLLAERFEQGAEGRRPNAWKQMLLTGIPKEKSLRELDKWRLISLTSVGQKVFLRPVMALVEEHRLASKVHTYGFRKHCSCAHIIELLRTLVLKANLYRKTLYILSCDVKGAFQGIQHDWVL